MLAWCSSDTNARKNLPNVFLVNELRVLLQQVLAKLTLMLAGGGNGIEWDAAAMAARRRSGGGTS